MNELNLHYNKNTLPKVNRELSWLAFNERVLFEAMDNSVPVWERLRFLGIYSNNLDEFFRVRVGTLHRILTSSKRSKLNYNPKEVLDQIYLKLKEDEKIFGTAFKDIKKELKEFGIHFLSNHNLNNEQTKWCREYFKKHIRKGIAPLLFKDNLRFPILRDKSIYLAIRLVLKNDKIVFSLIEVPTDFFSRFIELPSKIESEHIVIMLDDIIRLNLDEIYKVFDIIDAKAYTIKLTRDAELDMDNDFEKSDLDYISDSIKQRNKGFPVRFIADKSIPKDLMSFLLTKSKISKQNVVLSGRYHNFKDFMNFPDFGIADMRYPTIESIPNVKIENSKAMLHSVELKDICLFYPYNSFTYLLDFLREASLDPEVQEIKMSLYRLSKKSQIVNILANAVRNGKKVTVVMEITARFDEANNIYWANYMKDEGIKIIYGHPELKVHSKLVYISKRHNKSIKEYCNISTGNYNEVTADIYSDVSLFTSNKKLTSEVAKVFDFLENETQVEFKNLLVAPFNMRSSIVSKINREIENKKAGKKAYIILKINSMVDDEIIDKLYEARKQGVIVDIISRGICCVGSDIDAKEDLKAISIIDKFLEHSRVYYFFNAGQEECYISSADIMVRNLDYRVEVAAPIYDSSILDSILTFLKIQLEDNVKSRVHNANLSNAKTPTSKNAKKLRSQDAIYDWIARESKRNMI